MESIRSSATRFQCFCSSGTTMRLCTRPVDQLLENPEQVVRRHAEHRRAEAAELIEREHGPRRARARCARRFTRCTSVPTAQTEPAGTVGDRLDDVFGAAAVVGRLHDVPRHLGMHDDADAGMLLADRLDLLHGEARVDRAVTLPQDHLRALSPARDRGRRRSRSDPTRPSRRAGCPSCRRCCARDAGRAGRGPSRRARTPTSASPPRSTRCRRCRRARRRTP